MTANSNLRGSVKAQRRSTSGWWLGAHGHCHGALCVHSRTLLTGTTDAPTSTEESTLLLGPTAPSTLSNKRVLLYGLLMHPPPHLAPPHTLFCLLDPCTVKCAHIVVSQHRCAPISSLPPGYTRALVAVAALPLPISIARVYSGLVTVRAVAPPSSRPSLPPPYSSPPPTMTRPCHPQLPLSPPFNSPRGAPKQMRTSFPGSSVHHCKEVECRACASAKHEARAAAAPPHHITSVEIMCAPSPGVTIGLVPQA
ncbi:hypothetical protein C8F04DRAFT_1277237 [Mycena alexandri]|uniref:Uncharacterized protein n=1 Tax=Mycena alexandri TaxID=1745969 RepID=A0AAD6S0V2_9AGAR|nr:hypothetical protein C8F04DRAFT_1277237 [Mycena alexandri]